MDALDAGQAGKLRDAVGTDEDRNAVEHALGAIQLLVGYGLERGGQAGLRLAARQDLPAGQVAGPEPRRGIGPSILPDRFGIDLRGRPIAELDEDADTLRPSGLGDELVDLLGIRQGGPG
ncbi:MAG TPA: hypothetical protein VIC87_17200 [Vicinamibacteria bacterium]